MCPVCGGRGRCSTCRVRITQGLEGQPTPEAAELATLTRIGAPENVRLACQFRPVHNVSVVPHPRHRQHRIKTQLARQNAGGRERRVECSSGDLLDFTRIARTTGCLPTPVFLLNRYFEVVGEAVESSGGVVDKFIGDGRSRSSDEGPAVKPAAGTVGRRPGCRKESGRSTRLSKGS